MPRAMPRTYAVETARMKRYYAYYEAMGRARSLPRLHAAQFDEQSPLLLPNDKPLSMQLIKDWSAAWKWSERVRVYDEEQDIQRANEREAARAEMDDWQAEKARELSKKAIERLEALIAQDRLGSMATVQLWKAATDLERLARGSDAPGQKITHTIETSSDAKALLQQKIDDMAKRQTASASESEARPDEQ